MRVGVSFILACVLACAASAAERDLPPQTEWPGPLVEVTRAQPQAEVLTGFMLAFKEGVLQLRPLDGPDLELRAAQMTSMRFLAPRESVPPEEVRPDDAGPLFRFRRGSGERDIPQPLREKLEQIRDVIQLDALEKLSAEEQAAYRRMLLAYPHRFRPEDQESFDALRRKAGLPPLEEYRNALGSVLAARKQGKVPAYVERLRAALHDAGSFEEARRHFIGLLFAERMQDDAAPPTPGDLTQRLSDEVRQMRNERVREQVAEASKDILLDFWAMASRLERKDERRPLKRPALRDQRP